MPIAVVANPHIRTRKELLKLAQGLQGTEATATIIIGNLGLDPEEYSKYLPNTYFLSGAEDDIRITKQARKLNALLDGNIIELNGITVAGVGGIDPHQNMERILRLVKKETLSKRVNVTLSYHPPRDCGDLIKTIKVRRGLDELRVFIRELQPLVHVCGGEYLDTCLISITRTYVLGKGEAFALIHEDEGTITVKVLPLRSRRMT